MCCKTQNLIKINLNSGIPILIQIGKFLNQEIFNRAVSETKSDAYYKTLTTQKHFYCILYGVLTKCNSLNVLCKNLQFLDKKLTSISIDELPARSTLADANANRDSKVFELLFKYVTEHYSSYLDNETFSLISDIDGHRQVEIIDSSTISLFGNLFKGAGRNTISGVKKGGLKIHTKLPLGGVTPNLVHITESACNDKDFLGQLNYQANHIYVFDKGYVNHKKWDEIGQKGAFWVTRKNSNAKYEIIEEKLYDYLEYADGGIISDSLIEIKRKTYTLEARLIVYKDPQTGKVLSFISNLFDYNAYTIAQLYKYRWSIEVFFKRLKQNFQLDYFFSDSSEGIKTQIWIALIANVLMSIIHTMTKQKECFKTTVSMASQNMADYKSLIAIILQERPTKKPKIRIVQLKLFQKNKGVLF